MKKIDRNKKIFILLSTYIILLTTPKIKAEENKITFNDNYKIKSDVPFATYDNQEIYIGNQRYIEKINDDNSTNIYIIDDRENTDPNMVICDSHKIKQEKEMLNILKILLEYEKKYPSNWDRTITSMKREWIIHNICYLLNIKIESSENVDLNNADEEKYLYYQNIIKEIYDIIHENTEEYLIKENKSQLQITKKRIN